MPSTSESKLAWRPKIAVASLCLLLLVVVNGLALRDARISARARAVETLAKQAANLERDVSRSLKGYDILLQAIADGSRVVEQPLSDISQRLLFEAGSAELFGRIEVTDADGRVVRASRSEDVGTDLSGRSYFSRLRDGGSLGLVAGEPERSRARDRKKIMIGRRLGSPGEPFTGIVVGNIKLDYFNQAFHAYRPDTGMQVGLLTLDGEVLAAADPAVFKIDLSQSPVINHIRAQGAGVFEARGKADGVERLYDVQRLSDMPFYLLIGIPTGGIYAEWTVTAWTTISLLLCFLVLLGVLGLALRRELGQREMAERMSAAAAAELQLLADNIEDLVLKLDWDGRRLFVSAACERIMGVTQQELLGRNSLDFVHPDDKSQLILTLSSMRTEGAPRQITYRIRYHDGSWRFFEASLRRLSDGTGVIVVARDSTARIELESELRQAQRMDAVSQLACGIAHDLNNLLQVQTTALELLGDAVTDRPVAAKYVSVAAAMSERAAKLTHGLLAFSGQQLLQPAAIDLPTLLERLRPQFGELANPRIALRIDIEAALPRVLADTTQLEAALVHLCQNAVESMNAMGGALLIEAYRGEAVLDSLNRIVVPDRLVLAVSDEGSGMSPDMANRAPEPFFTTKANGEGSGLGLSMVQGFVQQSGGELKIQSWPNVGTRVEMWLPGARSYDLATALPPTAGFAMRPANLLLVDDEEGIRTLLGSVLRDAGYDVTIAASGEEAITILRSGVVFDALITDYALEGMSGTQLIAQSRVIQPSLPGMIITGYADFSALEQIPAGVEILYKPFRTDDLVLRVATMAGAGAMLTVSCDAAVDTN